MIDVVGEVIACWAPHRIAGGGFMVYAMLIVVLVGFVIADRPMLVFGPFSLVRPAFFPRRFIAVSKSRMRAR